MSLPRRRSPSTRSRPQPGTSSGPLVCRLCRLTWGADTACCESDSNTVDPPRLVILDDVLAVFPLGYPHYHRPSRLTYWDWDLFRDITDLCYKSAVLNPDLVTRTYLEQYHYVAANHPRTNERRNRLAYLHERYEFSIQQRTNALIRFLVRQLVVDFSPEDLFNIYEAHAALPNQPEWPGPIPEVLYNFNLNNE